jgi:DNA-binding protein H-NS
MTENLLQLSLHELAELVKSAEKALAEKKRSEHRNVIAKIKELADSIGVTVTIHETGTSTRGTSSRKGTKVAPKYRDPANPEQTWTGRGVKPRWLRDYTDKGRKIEDFLI